MLCWPWRPPPDRTPGLRTALRCRHCPASWKRIPVAPKGLGVAPTCWRGLLHWLSDCRTTPSRSQAANISLAERNLSESRRWNLEVTGGPQEVLHINHHWRHGLLGGADVRECGDDWLDVCRQGCQHQVVEEDLCLMARNKICLYQRISEN